MTKIFESIDPSGNLPDDVKTGLISLISEKTEELSAVSKQKYQHRANKVISDIKTEANKRMKSLASELKEACDKEINELKSEHAIQLDEQDISYTDKMVKLVEAIDSDRTEKMELVVEKLTKTKLDESVNVDLVNDVSKYLDAHLTEIEPTETLISEARMLQYEKMYSGLRELLVVNDDFVRTEVTEAIMDAKSQLSRKDTKISKLNESNRVLSESLDKIEATRLLEKKLMDLSPKESIYLESIFNGCGTQMIEDKFDEARKAFVKDETGRLKKLKEKSSSKIKTRINPIESAVKKSKAKATSVNLAESKTDSSETSSYVDSYAELCGNTYSKK